MESDGFVDATNMLQPAIYALLYQGVVVYIGQSAVPVARISAHKTNRKHPRTLIRNEASLRFSFDAVWLKACNKNDLDKIERELIRKYKPKYNVMYNTDNNKDEAVQVFRAAMANMIAAESQPTFEPIARRF